MIVFCFGVLVAVVVRRVGGFGGFLESGENIVVMVDFQPSFITFLKWFHLI